MAIYLRVLGDVHTSAAVFSSTLNETRYNNFLWQFRELLGNIFFLKNLKIHSFFVLKKKIISQLSAQVLGGRTLFQWSWLNLSGLLSTEHTVS